MEEAKEKLQAKRRHPGAEEASPLATTKQLLCGLPRES